MSKVSLSIDDGVLAEARGRQKRKLSSYVTSALRRQLQHDRIGALLVEMEAESGPAPEELMEEARELWRGPAGRKRRRRSASYSTSVHRLGATTTAIGPRSCWPRPSVGRRRTLRSTGS